MTILTPVPAAYGAMCYAPSASAIILFDQMSSPYYETLETNTYTWGGTNWTLGATGSYTAPPPRTGAAIAYDYVDSELLMFGGSGAEDGQEFNDLWSTTTGASWSPVVANYNSTGPTLRANAMMAGMTTGVVLFGGTANGFPWIYYDLWLYTTSTGWVNLIPTTATSGIYAQPQTFPPARYNAAFASNTGQGGAGTGGTIALLFGGRGYGGFGPLNDLWQLSGVSSSGATWTQLTLAGTVPSTRYGAAMCWNQANTEWLLFGGCDSSGRPLSDLYSFTISSTTATFTRLVANTISNTNGVNPLHLTGAVMASDGSTNTILWGGEDNSLAYGSTYKFSSVSNTFVQQ